jgi:hypothetical protein
MIDRDARAREIMRQIGTILLQDWDPLGVNHIPEAREEYESYVGGVYRLLASRANAAEIAEHLRKIEFRQMGLGRATIELLMPVAEKLVALNVPLERGSVA